MPHLDHDLLFALFLTILDVAAVGGAAALLLFPGFADRLMPRIEAADPLDPKRASDDPPVRKSAGPIAWGVTTYAGIAASRRP